MRTSSVWLLAGAAVLSAALAGCGGSDGASTVASESGSSTGAGTGTSTGTGSGSSGAGSTLLATVRSLLGMSSDTDRPVAVDALDTQNSETAQPEPVS